MSKRYMFPFYDPDSGSLAYEVRERNEFEQVRWRRWESGWIQDTWPRALARVCPDIDLPEGMEINEKQTSTRLRQMRNQDWSAPLRNFPGSHLTGPGRTGLGASGGRPTTTKKAVWAFLEAEQGNILLGPQGLGRVFVRGPGTEHEVWGLNDSGEIGWDVPYKVREVTDAEGEWLDYVDRQGRVRYRYPMGYPFPYLPTGQRHPAFVLTDRLIEAGKPVALPWMPEKWQDFTFRADGMVLARRADGGNARLAPWHWSNGHLWIDIDGNREAPEWDKAAEMLGITLPPVWVPPST